MLPDSFLERWVRHRLLGLFCRVVIAFFHELCIPNEVELMHKLEALEDSGIQDYSISVWAVFRMFTDKLRHENTQSNVGVGGFPRFALRHKGYRVTAFPLKALLCQSCKCHL